MSVIGSEILAGASGNQGYFLQRSLRFRSSASAYLNRTPSSTTNQKTFTISMWIKRGNSGGNISLVSCRSGASPLFQYQFYSDDTLSIEGSSAQIKTTQVFRDFSSWYHVVLAIDTTQATASNRMKMYVNGTQVTSFSTATYPSQNTNFNYNVNSATSIGSLQPFGSQYFDGYLTEIYSIDGQALDASSFGETSAKTGVWQPKKYAGTYGTNGFYLPFSDNSSTTTLGYDKSGNSNNWTCNNISITAGSTYDSMTDVPTLTSETVSNFATLSPLNPNGSGYTNQGNLAITGANAYKSTNSTIPFPSTGVWYWEGVFLQANNNLGFGCMAIGPNAPPNPLANTNGIAITSNGYWYLDTSTGTNGHTGWSASTVVGMKWDSSTNTFSYTVDGTTYNTVGSVSTTDGRQWAAACWAYATNDQVALNFGQRPFTYSIPTGAKALNTYNLPTPTIGATASTQANKYFDIALYTGNGASRSITGYNFAPDFVWIKGRSDVSGNRLFDIVRGATKRLISNLTNAEGTESDSLTSFNSDGYSLGADTVGGGVNLNAVTYVGWAWDAGGTGVTNTAGSITSTVSANTSAGFSVVTYTGNGSGSATVGHGLGVAPKFVIVKARNATGNFVVYTTATGAMRYAYLNSTSAGGTPSESAPTSTVFSVSAPETNTNGNTHVAYCFAEVAGYSKFGSYTGNGSSDGTFVYTGFRPRFVMVKCTSSVADWVIEDSARNANNITDLTLFPNLSAAEVQAGTYPQIDFLSNGFKIRSTSAYNNSNAATYIYAAFAETPTKFALAR